MISNILCHGVTSDECLAWMTSTPMYLQCWHVPRCSEFTSWAESYNFNFVHFHLFVSNLQILLPVLIARLLQATSKIPPPYKFQNYRLDCFASGNILVIFIFYFRHFSQCWPVPWLLVFSFKLIGELLLRDAGSRYPIVLSSLSGSLLPCATSSTGDCQQPRLPQWLIKILGCDVVYFRLFY